jgi:GntR family transcriptional regulator/MocR family aminotransferase
MWLIKEIVTIDRRSRIPAYLQMAHAIVEAIHQGKLRKGLRLPGARRIAEELKVNRLTVAAAFKELESQGWIEILPQKGAVIKVDLPTLTPRKLKADAAIHGKATEPGFTYEEKKPLPYSSPDFPPSNKLVLNAGFPDPRLAPMEALVSTIRRLSRQSRNKKYLGYGGGQGTPYLRETLTTFLNDTRGLSITPANILITNGAQMGLYLAASLLLQNKSEVIVGTPGYARANRTFSMMGARVHYVPVDENGLDVSQIERLCHSRKIQMIYAIPHHHHPTSVTLAPERRIQLLELAARYQFAIVEDDYDYEFHYLGNPMMPMASLDRNGNVIYVGTLSKSLAPAIRVGFMVGPIPFIESATRLRKMIDTQGDSLVENAIAELYQDGTIDRHIKKSVKLYKERRDHFCGLLGSELGRLVSFRVPDGGMSVWTRFIDHSLLAVTKTAFERGLVLEDGTDYDTSSMKYNSTALGFASLNFAEQERAIGLLKEILK